jgi:iron(II)-dependent oxidoreductase
MRQALGYSAPRFMQASAVQNVSRNSSRVLGGDLEIPGGTFLLGARRDEGFVFDNEKWAHLVDVAPFTISAETVTQEQFASFVDSGGYRRREVWDDDGWAWREQVGAQHPIYWTRDGGESWLRRDFDKLVPLEPRRPMIHLNWYEAEAWCRWAGRRLPSEAEWEMAAAGAPDLTADSAAPKRRYPWGDEPPTSSLANFDWAASGAIDVAALSSGDCAFGCRQILGNVWEWTSSRFGPYPGFTPDPYREYSQPWFHTRYVLRGGCWATRSRLLRNTLRNFFMPDRRDIFAGFRTCGLRK